MTAEALLKLRRIFPFNSNAFCGNRKKRTAVWRIFYEISATLCGMRERKNATCKQIISVVL
jgi:hypothetical protein